MNNSKEMIWSVDREHRLATFNKAFSDEYVFLTGELPAPGVFHYNAFGPDGESHWKQKVDDALKGDTVIFEYSYEIAGRVKHTHVFMCPVRNGESIVGTTCFMVNISPQKIAEEIQQRQFEELQQLYNLARLVDREDSLEKIYDHAMDLLTGGFKADRCSILLFDTDGIMRFEASRGISAAYRKAAEGHSPWKPGTKNPAPIFVEDVAQEQSLYQLRPVINAEGIKSLGFIPLICRDQIIGKFMIYYNQVHSFSESEIQFVQTIAQDIAIALERKRSEDQLHSQYSLLTALINSPGNIIIFSLDKNYCYTAFNKTHCAEMKKVWNVDIKIGMNLLECISRPETRELAKCSIDRSLQGEAFSEIQQQPGLDTYYEFSWNPVSQNNEITGVTVFIQDITRRKQTEQALKESENNLKEAQRIAHIGSWELDHSNNKLKWSDEIFRIIERDPQTVNLTYEDFLEMVHPDDRERVNNAFAYSVVNKTKYEIVHRIILPDGRIKFLYERGETFYNEEGKPVRSIGTGQDITEREKSEEQTQKEKELSDSVINSMPGIFYLVDNTGKFLRWNRNFEIVSGYNAGEIANMHPLDFTDPDERGLIAEKIDEVFRKGSTEVLANFFSKDGKKIPYFLNGWRIEYEKKPCLIGVGIDISKRKQAEDALKESERLLRESQAIAHLGNYVWDISAGVWKSSTILDEILGIDENYDRSLAGWRNLIHPDWLQLLMDYISTTVLRNHQRFDMEFKIIRQNTGQECWVSGFGELEFDDDGQPKKLIGTISDINERKQAGEALQESKNILRAVLDNAPIGIWMQNSNGQMLFVNQKFCSSVGIPEERFLEVPHYAGLYTPEVAAACIASDKAAIAEAGLHISHEQLPFTDGKVHDVEIIKVRITEKQNGLSGLIGLSLDITERKQAEEKLRVSEQKYRSMIERNLAGIYQSTTEGKILTCNDAFAHMLGYSSHTELLNKNARMLYFSDTDRNKLISGLKKKGELNNQEITLKHKDGSPVYLYENCILFKDTLSGKNIIEGVMLDITKRKKAEEQIQEQEKRYRALVDSAPDAIIIVDEKGMIQIANMQAEKLFGYTKAELTGMTVEMLMPRQHRRRHKDFHREFISERLDRPMGIGRELIALRKDGLVIPVEISLSVFDGAGGVLSTASIRDITQRKKAEKELEESYQSVRRLTEYLQNIREEERTHIAREIHDELGQQLTVMKMDVSWLYQKLGKTNETVGQRAGELKKMLDQTVMTVRRIASELRPSILDDMGLGAAIEWHLSEFEKRSGVKTELDKTKTELLLPGAVKTGLFRIVQESLTNVSRYAKAKKVTVSLRKKGKQIVLVIKDNGAGFDIEKIASKKTLGIIGMRERSFIMGGTYEISSAPGKGTTVIVKIPFGE